MRLNLGKEGFGDNINVQTNPRNEAIKPILGTLHVQGKWKIKFVFGS